MLFNVRSFYDSFFIFIVDISDLFSQVDYIQTKLQQTANKSLNDDIILLRKLYQTSEFQNALSLYNKLVNLNTIKRIKPICDNTYNLAEEVSFYRFLITTFFGFLPVKFFIFNGNSYLFKGFIFHYFFFPKFAIRK